MVSKQSIEKLLRNFTIIMNMSLKSRTKLIRRQVVAIEDELDAAQS
jgi:hypothetical protein